MRRIKGLLAGLMTLALALSLLVPARAAEDYTYTVRIFSGKQGTIGGSQVVTYSGLHYGDRISFSAGSVTLADSSKYYVRGIKLSGRDNDTALTAASFLVTEDADYVVAYGLLGSSVAYTVSYVDEAGNTLAPSETYYGNVGDRPVVAYLYMDGYRPQAYNLTGSLRENAAENAFTFVYTKLPGAGNQNGQGGGNAGTVPGTAPANGTAGQTAGAAPGGTQNAGGNNPGTANPGTQVNENNPDAADTNVENNNPETVIATPEPTQGQTGGENGDAQPQEIEDIHDEEIPLAGGNAVVPQEESGSRIFSPAVRIGIAGVLGAGLILYLVLVLRKRKERKTHEE